MDEDAYRLSYRLEAFNAALPFPLAIPAGGDQGDGRQPSGSPQTADLAESLGAKNIGFWFAFGEFDGISLSEAPANATALAITMAAAGGGAISNLETTVLVDMDEAQEAMRKAAQATYRPPS